MSSRRDSSSRATLRAVPDAWALVAVERRNQAILSAQDAVVEHLTHDEGIEEALAAVTGLVEDVTAVSTCRVEAFVPVRHERPALAVADPGTERLALVAPDGAELGWLVLEVPGGALADGALADDDAAVVARATRLATTVLARAAERRRLGESVALLGSVLESTEDGILSVDSQGRTAGFNKKFTEMWLIDADLAESQDDARMIEFVLSQLVDPEGFVRGVTALYGSSTATSFDELHFLDGRVFERYSQPQLLDGEAVGRVWSFRDVTAERRLQQDLELLSAVATASNSAASVELALADTLVALCRYGGWQMGHALLVGEQDGVLSRSVWHEAQPGRLAAVRELVEGTFPDVHSLPGRVLATGEPEVVPLPEGRSGPSGQCAADHGISWMCAFPVLARDEVVGVLEFWASRPQPDEGRLLRALGQVGAQVGRVIERDRTERRLARHARQLERLTGELDSVLNSVGEGIYGLDATGRITFVNEAASRLLRLPRASMVGRPVDEVIQVAPTAGVKVPVAPPALGGGAVSIVTGRHVRADGSDFASELSSAPVVQDGAVVGSVSVLRDISERQAVDRLKDEFIAMVSHELRTPLTSIRGALGLLGAGSAGELGPRAARMVEVATTSSDRLIRLINDILDVERMAAGKLTVQLRPTLVADLMRTAAEEMAGLAESSGVEIRVSACGASVLADPDRIVQTLGNLLGNAVKYSEPGGVVGLDAALVGDEVRFDVSDTGPGIPADQLESIFEPFRQVDGSDSRRAGGTGLGLAICQGLVEHHQGRIWASSTFGDGTTLSFTLRASGCGTAG